MLKVLQINLHRSKLASAELLLTLEEGGYDVALVQEPWLASGNVVSGLRSPNLTTYIPKGADRVRTVILVKKGINSYILNSLSVDDLTVVALEAEEGGNNLILASCYMPHDEETPSRELQRLVEIAGDRKQDLVIGADANAHHTVWGSTDINDRGESLLNYIIQSRLSLANRGEEPTFIGPTSKNVLDITLITDDRIMIRDWKVLEEPSFSDHNYISFNIDFHFTKIRRVLRNPRNTNWELYGKILTKEMGKNTPINSNEDVEALLSRLTRAFIKAYNTSCPPTRIKRRRQPPWWNKELGARRQYVRETLKLARLADCEVIWEEYRDVLKLFKKEIRVAKRNSWRNFCAGIEKTVEVARLRKLLSKHPSVPNLVRKENGTWTKNNAESLEDLISTHFPGCGVVSNTDPARLTVGFTRKDVITHERLDWAINSFESFKSPGPDGIIPAMIQKASRLVIPRLKNIYEGCLKLNYVPANWRVARVVFIPKAGKSGHLYSKDYRPISLTSFILKIFEKLLANHIGDRLGPEGLSKSQHAYIKGRSTETALHTLVFNVEKALEYKEYALGVFLDIAGAFNNVSTNAILESLNAVEIDPAIYHWIASLLNGRRIMAEWNETILTREARRGTPQGGVLSPLLWLLVVNQILTRFEGKAPRLVAYADDIAIVITGRCLTTLSALMTDALKTIHNWARNAGLSVNAEKTDLLLFTRKYKVPAWTLPSLDGVPLSLKSCTKYLGVMVDNKLTWRSNVEERVKKATNALYACKRMLGSTWGLSPALMHWCYTAIVRPILLYGILVWWKAVRKKTYLKPLVKVQRLSALCITGAMKSTPTAALEAILNLIPIDLYAENRAANSAVRLQITDQLTSRTFAHSSIIGNAAVNSDYMVPVTSFGKPLKTVIEDDGWRRGLVPRSSTINVFTDGSKTEKGVGAGIYCAELSVKKSFKLPNYCTVFQAEVFAVRKAAELVCTEATINCAINFYVDSQAAIKAIKSYCLSSKNVHECKEAINKLARNRRLCIYWVPGHQGIEGNEIVDEIAKKGANLAEDRISQVLKPLRTIQNELEEHMLRKAKGRWLSLTNCKVARIMCKRAYDERYTESVISFDRRNCRTLVGVLTGHCLVAAHAYKLNLTSNDACRKCKEPCTKETMEHILCCCPALSKTRLRYLGVLSFERLERIPELELKRLLKFANSTRILSDAYFR